MEVHGGEVGWESRDWERLLGSRLAAAMDPTFFPIGTLGALGLEKALGPENSGGTPGPRAMLYPLP